MPELPDITVYVEALRRYVCGETLTGVRIRSPFLLRTVAPPPGEVVGRTVAGVERLGKRIVLGFDGPAGECVFFVLHLMVAGRLRWRKRGAGIPGRIGLAALDFPSGTLLLTEASKRKRASLHVVAGREALAAHDPGGLEVLDAGLDAFRERLLSENHTLKRALTSPRLLSGIGNAYSDEILHAARLSPLKWTSRLDEEEVGRLHAATVEMLTGWTDRLRLEVGDGFPERVTALRDDMAVHGRFGEPCPRCDSPVQRIVYAENETNYCATCQTNGAVLADRALSRLMRGDWPRTLEEWEERGRTT